MAFDLDPERTEKLFRRVLPQATRAAVSRADARSRTFRRSRDLKFLPAGEVGMARPRTFDQPRVFRLGFQLFGGHDVFPMDEVIVLDEHRHGRTKCFSVPNSGEDRRRVRFDLHPPAAAVALLAPPELVIDLRGVDLQSRRQALDDRG